MRVSEWKEEAGTPRVVLRLGLLLVVPIMAQAERLPINTYTTADGLGSDYILDITRDSRGFLWFSTRDGLSRFDGSRFITYGTGHGLPDPTVNDFLETRHGVCWVATNGGGVCRFNPDSIENHWYPRHPFHTLPSLIALVPPRVRKTRSIGLINPPSAIDLSPCLSVALCGQIFILATISDPH